jgi:peptidoglycan/LPS O-acetylase OafA/YrhL
MGDPAPSIAPSSARILADRTRSDAGSSFRPDLEGLRGLAILLVLMFHAGLPGTSGGFIGVDVFFVLSGFLITGLLIRERESTGRVDLRAFYARRARRILPAALVVLAGILAASWVMLPPLDLGRTAADVAAAALSLGNIRFATQATDYFASDVAPSPVLHYWSLGVEEQFYLVWPALLILATAGGRIRLRAFGTLAVVGIASFAASLFLTDAQPAWAFYSLPTRAWELALGGVLAVAVPRLVGLPDRLVAPLGWLGLAAIVLGLVSIDPSAPYPGLAALLPTLGAAAIVVAGSRPGSVGLILERSPMRWLGRISYSLYLVHWPILVLPAASLAVDQTLPLSTRIGLALLAVAVGAACQRFVEVPFHRGRRARLPSGRTLALAGSAVAVTVVLAAGVAVAAVGRLTPGPVVAAIGPGSSPEPSVSAGPILLDGTPGPGEADPFASPEPEASPSGSADLTSPLAGASSSQASGPPPSPSPRPAPAAPTGPEPLPRNVRPSLADAPNDFAPLEREHCMLGATETKLWPCVFGDPSSSTTVVLVGDSHAAEWFPAVEAIAKQRDWRLIVMTKVSCRFVDLPMISRELKRPYTECYTWRAEVVARLKALHPALTIVSVARSMEATTAADDDPARQGTAMGPLFAGVPGKIALIVDTPQSLYDVPACISAHINDVRACETPRGTAFSWRYLKLERAAVRATGAKLVNMSDQICASKSCPVVLHDMIIYKDSHHLTATFARSLAGVLGARLPAP